MMFLTAQPIESLSDLISKVEVNSISFIELFTSLLIAFFIGLYIFLVYKFAFQGTIYNYSFNFSLIIMTLVTTLVILTISSNLILSLGMVGALSIVRFRSALKDPIDIVYIFWSIAGGLAVGATQYLLAVYGSVFIGIVIIVLSLIRVNMRSYLLIIHYDLEIDEEIKKIITTGKTKLKSKYIKGNHVELTLEIHKDHDQMIQALRKLDVIDVSLLSFEE